MEVIVHNAETHWAYGRKAGHMACARTGPCEHAVLQSPGVLLVL